MWCAGPQEHSQPGSVNPQIWVGNCIGTGVVPRKIRAMIWVQSVQLLSHVHKKRKSDTVSTVSPSICHEVMGPAAMMFVF